MRAIACVLALAIGLPAHAERHRSLAECTSFGTADKGEDALQLTITNSCSVPVDCSISWKVVCAPASKKRRAVHASSASLSVVEGATKSTEATASACGDDPWEITGIEWSCQPNKD